MDNPENQQISNSAIDLIRAFAEIPPEPDYVLPGLRAQSIGAMVSPGGAGKSMAALEIGVSLASGYDLLDLGVYERQRVTYLPAEDPGEIVNERVHAIGKHMPLEYQQMAAEKLNVVPLVGKRGIDITSDKWIEPLIQIGQKSRLIILDTLRRFHSHEENDSGAMSEVIKALEHIAQHSGASIIFTHHANKSASVIG